MRSVVPRDVERLVQGDVGALDIVRAAPHEAVLKAWLHSEQPSLTAAALRGVLADLIEGRVAPDIVQSWASFIMHGYLEPVGPPTMPVEVEYESKYEEPIIETIAVLEQMGDLIDGQPSESQLRQFIDELSQ